MSPLPSQFQGKAGMVVGGKSTVVAWVVAGVVGLGMFGAGWCFEWGM
jgi:hypothetical protein